MMKRILSLLLMLALLVPCLPALAEGSGITVQVRTDKTPLYKADDPAVAGLLAPPAEGEEAEALPVLVLPVKKSLNLIVSIQPPTQRNRRYLSSSADDRVARVKGNTVTGVAAGETVVTFTSEADRSAQTSIRVLVVQPVTRLTVTSAAKAVAVGGTINVQASVTPANATLKDVAWSSSDTRIARVDENGTVTGVKRGSARITATAKDGSNVRASLNIQVNQAPERISLDRSHISVAAGKTVALKASILPTDANDKNVTWTSTNTAVATVNNQGRVTGKSLGDCQIICASRANPAVQATAEVHVSQPVTGISFGPAPDIYVGEKAQITWTVLPSNASNSAVTLSSSNRSILQVASDGTVTGLKAGEAYVNATSTDGTNRTARLKVRVMQHVTGVHMKRRVAYIDPNETCTVTAIVEPGAASNQKMTWYMVEEDIATFSLGNNAGTKVKVKGLRNGITTLVGTTVDGGYEARLTVNVGDWDHALKITDAKWSGSSSREVDLKVRNNSSLNITKIIAEVQILDSEGKGVPCNKDGGSKFRMEYRYALGPGQTTSVNRWKLVDFVQPTATNVATYKVTIYQYIVDNDWVKTIRENRRPTKKIPIHL